VLQKSSPHEGSHDPQSAGQITQYSIPAHTPSPQAVSSLVSLSPSLTLVSSVSLSGVSVVTVAVSPPLSEEVEPSFGLLQVVSESPIVRPKSRASGLEARMPANVEQGALESQC
jgi:hypothetical protein